MEIAIVMIIVIVIASVFGKGKTKRVPDNENITIAIKKARAILPQIETVEMFIDECDPSYGVVEDYTESGAYVFYNERFNSKKQFRLQCLVEHADGTVCELFGSVDSRYVVLDVASHISHNLVVPSDDAMRIFCALAVLTAYRNNVDMRCLQFCNEFKPNSHMFNVYDASERNASMRTFYSLFKRRVPFITWADKMLSS